MEEKSFCQENNSSIEIDFAYNQFIDEFHKLLRDRDLKQKDLAAKAGVNRTSLNKFIKKGTVPSFEIFFKVLHAYLGRSPISLSKFDISDYQSAITRIKSILSELP